MSRRKAPAPLNAEIRRLQQVVAVLGAVVIAFDYNDDGIDLSDAVRVALGLVRESIAGLDRPAEEVRRGPQ